MSGCLCGRGAGSASRQRREPSEIGIYSPQRLRPGVRAEAAGKNGGGGTDGGTLPGRTGRTLPHLPLSQPGNPGGHGGGPAAVRRGPPGPAHRHGPGLRPHGRGGTRRAGRLPPDHRQRDGGAAAGLSVPDAGRPGNHAPGPGGRHHHRLHGHGLPHRRTLRRGAAPDADGL